MELSLEVVASASIKRKKPWPKVAWLGEGERMLGLYLLDSSRISQLSSSTGKTKNTFPSLASIVAHIVFTCHSSNGAFLAGLTRFGEVFTWYEHTQELCTYQSPLSGNDERADEDKLAILKACKLFVADSGELGTLVVHHSEVYLWRVKKRGVAQWWKVSAPSGMLPPSLRETGVQACFYGHLELGDCCSVTFVHTNRDTSETILNHLLVQWCSPYQVSLTHTFPSSLLGYSCVTTSTLAFYDGRFQPVGYISQREAGPALDTTSPPEVRGRRGNTTTEQASGLSVLPDVEKQAGVTPGVDEAVPFQASWKTIPLSLCLSPPTRGGGYCIRFCPTGGLLALAVNCSKAEDSVVFFFSLLTEVGLSVPVYAEARQGKDRHGRTYWIADMAWFADGLFLACMTKRGSVLILPRFGRPALLTTHGCSLDMGPLLSLPLHPLVTVISADKILTNHDTSESSERDAMRQRFSVSTHPFSPMLICSDGYCFTILKMAAPSLPNIIMALTNSARSVLGLVPMGEADAAALSSAGTSNHGPPGTVTLLSPEELHMTQTIKTREPDCATFEGTLGSTLGMNGGGWDPLGHLAMGQEVGGVIHFADVDSDPDLALGWTGGASLVRFAGFSVPLARRALPDLYAAWALLMSSCPLEVGNGTYPSSRSYSDSQVGHLRAHVVRSSVLAVSTLASVAGFLCSVEGQGWEDVASSCLDLVGLDCLDQRHFSHSSLLANAIAQVLLSHTLTLHGQIRTQLRSRFDLQVMLDLIGSVGNRVWSIAQCLHLVGITLESAYSVVSSHLRTGEGFASSIPLTSTLCSASRVLTILLNDLKLCRCRIRKWKSKKKEPMALKWGELYKQVRASARNAVSSVRCLYGSITRLLGPSSSAVGAPTLRQSSEANKPCCHGNPITSPDAAVASALSSLYRRLECYDFKCALEIGSSYFASREARANLAAVPSTSLTRDVGHSSKVSLTGTTGLERILSDAERASKRVGLLTEAGSAVLTTLARLMAAFFCKRRLLILPSSHPHPLPHHSTPYCQNGRGSWYVELDRPSVERALSEQGVGSLWSPDYSVRLMLLCGLWEETCEFLSTVGEWRKSLLVAAVCYGLWHRLDCPLRGADLRLHKDSVKLLACRAVEGALLPSLMVGIVSPSVIPTSEGNGINIVPSLVDRTKKELFRLVSGTINACALVGFDEVASTLLKKLTAQVMVVCSQLSLEVPVSCPLPSPPLYMLQPGIEEEVYIQCPREFDLRSTLVALTQNVLLVLRAANCLQPCIQWYAGILRSLHTDSAPGLCVPERDITLLGEPISPKSFVQNLNMDCCHFSQDVCDQSPEVKVILSAFRELCAVHWMMHARDEAFLHARRLWSPCSIFKSSNLQKDPAVADRAAQWMARLLPFSDLLSHTTEDSGIDHILLSLLAELPCDTFLADLAAFCYPIAPTVPDSLSGRFERFVAKLRSHYTLPPAAQPSGGGAPRRPSAGSGGEPLSARYHIQSQRVLAKQQQFEVALAFVSSLCQTAPNGGEVTTGQDRATVTLDVPLPREECYGGPPPGTSSSQQTAPAAKARATPSGRKENAGATFLFEHDREYVRFLDTFFEIILSADADAALEYPSCGLGISPQGQGVELDQPPFLGMYWNTMDREVDVGPCWSKVVPLLSLLHEWTQSPDIGPHSASNVGKPGDPLRPGLRASEPPQRWLVGRRQRRRRSLSQAATSLLVSIPAGQLVHALQLEEKRHGVSNKDGTSERGSLERVVLQDQGCQEEEREKYLKTLQSLEVESNGAVGEGVQDSTLGVQDSTLGVQDSTLGVYDDSVTSVESNAPNPIHTSEACHKDQDSVDAPHSFLPLSVPVESVAVRELVVERNGTIGETASCVGCSSTHTPGLPLLQIPTEVLKGTIPINFAYPWATSRHSVSEDRGGAGIFTANDASVEDMEDDSQIVSIGELPLSATLSFGEAESTALSITSLACEAQDQADLAGGEKASQDEEHCELEVCEAQKAGMQCAAALLGTTEAKAGGPDTSSSPEPFPLLSVAHYTAQNSTCTNSDPLPSRGSGGHTLGQPIAESEKIEATPALVCTHPAAVHSDNGGDHGAAHYRCECSGDSHHTECVGRTAHSGPSEAIKDATSIGDENRTTDNTKYGSVNNAVRDSIDGGVSSKRLHNSAPCDRSSLLLRPPSDDDLGGCYALSSRDPTNLNGPANLNSSTNLNGPATLNSSTNLNGPATLNSSTNLNGPVISSVNSTHHHPMVSTATDVLPDDAKITQTRDFPGNGMNEIKKLLELQHQYLMNVLDMSAPPCAPPVRHRSNNGHQNHVVRERPAVREVPSGTQLQPTAEPKATASSRGLSMPEGHTSDAPVHSHISASHTTEVPTMEIQSTSDTSSKGLSLLDLVRTTASSHLSDCGQVQSEHPFRQAAATAGRGVPAARRDSVPTGVLGLPFVLRATEECQSLPAPSLLLSHHAKELPNSKPYPLLTINYESIEQTPMFFPPPPPPPPPPLLPHLPFPLLTIDHSGAPPLFHVPTPLLFPPEPLPRLTTPTHPNGSRTSNLAVQELRLPAVPVRPFVPRLIDPRATTPPLLQLRDPVTQLQRMGFPLLHIPPMADGGKEERLSCEPQGSAPVGQESSTGGKQGGAHQPAGNHMEVGEVPGKKHSLETERERRVRRQKASAMKRHLHRKRVSWQKGQSFEADCDTSLSSHSSFVSDTQASIQAPPSIPSHPNIPSTGASHLEAPPTGSFHLQAPPTGPSHFQAPPTGPSHLQAPPTGQSHHQAPPTGQSHLQAPVCGLSENLIPCMDVLLGNSSVSSVDSLEVRRRDRGATYFGSSPEHCGTGAKAVDRGTKMVDSGAKAVVSGAKMVDNGAEMVVSGAKMVDNGAKTVDSGTGRVDISDIEAKVMNSETKMMDIGANGAKPADSGADKMHNGSTGGLDRAEHKQCSPPPAGQALGEAVGMLPIRRNSTVLQHSSEHSELTGTSATSSELVLVAQQSHPKQAKGGPGIMASQCVEEPRPLASTSLVQRDRELAYSSEVVGVSHAQCVQDNPPPMQFVHMVRSGHGNGTDSSMLMQPPTVTSHAGPSLAVSQSLGAAVPTPHGVMSAPDCKTTSVSVISTPGGAISTPGAALSTPIGGAISTPGAALSTPVGGAISTPGAALSTPVGGAISTPGAALSTPVGGAISTPGAALSTPVGGAPTLFGYIDTKDAQTTGLSQELCTTMEMETAESPFGDKDLVSTNKDTPAFKMDVVDGAEPGTSTGSMGHLAMPSNPAHVQTHPAHDGARTRAPIEETWTRAPYAVTAAPIGGLNNDFLKKLKSLDDQLYTIEATAQTMAGDLRASNQLLSTISNLQGICDISAPACASSLVSSPDCFHDVCVEMMALHSSKITKSSNLPVSDPCTNPSTEAGGQVETCLPHDNSHHHGEVVADGNKSRETITNLNFTQTSKDSPELGGGTNMGATMMISEGGTKELNVGTRDETRREMGAVPRGGTKMGPGVHVGAMKTKNGTSVKTARGIITGSKNTKEAVRTAENGSKRRSILTSSQVEGNSENEAVLEEVPVRTPRHLADEHIRFSTTAVKPITKKKSCPKPDHPGPQSRPKPDRPGPQPSAQWKEFHARRVEDALALMADMMSSKPALTALHKTAVTSRPPLGNRGKNTGTAVQRATASLTDGSSNTLTDTTLLISKKRTSTIEGLSRREQEKIAEIMASTEYEGNSVSSESVAASIDWEQVDQLLAA